MYIRPANNTDLTPIFTALQQYATIYSKNDTTNRSPAEFIDGRAQNVTDASWLHYEGTTVWFPPGMLAEAIPRLVMNALVSNEDCVWIVVDDSVAVQHPLLGPPITFQSLTDGTWLNEYDYDESLDKGEIALDSYGDLMTLFGKKRIHGVSPLH